MAANGKTDNLTYMDYLEALSVLVSVYEAKDRFITGHSEKVTELATAIGKQLFLTPDLIEKIRISGKIHDIGKVCIPDAILNKPTWLTAEEWQYIKAHCDTGERILQPIVADAEILSMVRHHHERFDGKGYPDGISGEQIPIGARILAAADAYDAMMTDRPYRTKIKIPTVIAEVEREKGRQFDPVVVDALIRTIRK
jgi:putative two-component system response regulator